MEDYELLDRIDRIICSNVKTYEYEGDDVDRRSLKSDIFELIKELLKEK